jgi:hypothetical protein
VAVVVVVAVAIAIVLVLESVFGDAPKGELGWWPAQHAGSSVVRAVGGEQRASGGSSPTQKTHSGMPPRRWSF